MFAFSRNTYGKKNSHVIIVFGWWGARSWQMALLGYLLASYNFKAIIYSYDRTLLTTNPDLTSQHFQLVLEDALKAIKDLPLKQQADIAVMGISLGTFLAFMLANKSPHVNKVIANLSGASLADIIWSWNQTKKDFKKQLLKEHITLRTLKEKWQFIAPLHNTEKIHAQEILFYLASKDEVMPIAQQELLLSEMRSEGLDIQAIINTRHNHTISWIVNLLRFDVYIRFLKKRKKKLLRGKRHH